MFIEIELAISRNVNVSTQPTSSEIEADKKIKETTEDPNITFKKMEGYVKMVTKGINPSVILCGAPGVGKTYRVKKILEEDRRTSWGEALVPYGTELTIRVVPDEGYQLTGLTVSENGLSL